MYFPPKPPKLEIQFNVNNNGPVLKYITSSDEHKAFCHFCVQLKLSRLLRVYTQLSSAQHLLVNADISQSLTYQASVDKLDGGRVLKEVLPFWFLCHEILRNPPVCHLREWVVHKPSIKPSHKCTCAPSEFRNMVQRRFVTFHEEGTGLPHVSDSSILHWWIQPFFLFMKIFVSQHQHVQKTYLL